MRRILIAIPLMLLTAYAGARPMNFDEAKRAALENSYIIKSYEEKEKAASYRHMEAVGNYLPKVTLTQTYSRTDEPANAAFSSMAQGRFDNNYFQNKLPDPDYVTNHQSKIQIMQPIFMRGQIVFGIRQAEEAYAASRFETERVKQRTLFNLHRAFYGLALAEKALDVVKHSYDRTKRYYNTAQDFYENGLIVQSDLLVSESYLLMNEQAVKDAEKQHAVAMSQLQRLLATDDPIEIIWTDPHLSFKEDIDSYIKTGLENRQDLSAMKRYSSVTKLESTKAKAAFLPSVSVFADYQRNDDEMFGDNGDGYTFGAQMELNLFNGFSDYNKTRETKSAHYAMLHEIADKRLAIKSEIKNSFYGVIAASKQIEASQKRVEAAQKALEITENRFNEGLSKVTELLDREVDLKQAELSLYMSEYQQIVEKAGLQLASGTLD
ncbi:outer membrane efflux protein [Denitrovibrio acetiphilus DSM 12809]|uniref:Outer membrane efflux protein n=1 Tax=Denitrovibrio acetiphilus (strain DSM 12809 / NBRC 114555 / N2460) TaxID=522772 RepID=D4H3P5_DENA2|nr:TolC family protein [Denitrovibrio acetiphilus]ADD69147.1 outer membrane efflux protein [Denitrovibrio acetiphilus DSM 12809]